MSDSSECTGTLGDSVTATVTPQLSSDMQASIRFAYWSMVSSSGLGVAGGVARGRVSGRLELSVGKAGGAMARRYADESIEVSPEIAQALLLYHEDPIEHSRHPIRLGSPLDACLTVLHETVHCCGKVEPSDRRAKKPKRFATASSMVGAFQRISSHEDNLIHPEAPREEGAQGPVSIYALGQRTHGTKPKSQLDHELDAWLSAHGYAR